MDLTNQYDNTYCLDKFSFVLRSSQLSDSFATIKLIAQANADMTALVGCDLG
jgi:hypothetical protein